jgi:transcription elongation factor Elf1
MKRTDTGHLRAENGGSVLHCLHCGDKYRVTLPALVDVYCATTKAYIKAHKHCKPREKEAT